MISDTLTEGGARGLAHKITRYWQRKGYKGIAVRIEPIETIRLRADEILYTVRSNIGPLGYPPRETAA